MKRVKSTVKQSNSSQLTNQTALVYDWVVKWGGAERVLLALKEIFPDSPLYTGVYCPDRSAWAQKFEIRSTFLNRMPGGGTHHRALAPLMPLAFETLDLKKYRRVISVSSWAAKGVLTAPEAIHLNYCLTPTRFLWSDEKGYRSQPGWGSKNSLARVGLNFFSHYLKRWDLIAARRPDATLAISKTVSKRLKKFYGVTAEVVYPPVETDFFRPGKKSVEQSWLVVSRLEPYKKVELVVKAFNRLGWPLIVVGEGSQSGKLKKLARANVKLVGCVEDEKLLSYYHSAQAVVCPQEEDFGLVAVEAQACGRPVLAFGRGGLTETVVSGQTGDFFSTQSESALYQSLIRFRPKQYDSAVCRRQALRFSRNQFIKRFSKKAGEVWQEFQIES